MYESMKLVSMEQGRSDDAPHTVGGRRESVLVAIHLIVVVVFMTLAVGFEVMTRTLFVIRRTSWVSLSSSTLQPV